MDENIDLPAIFAAIWVRKWWVATSVLLCTGAFATAAFLMTPVYRASVVLVAADTARNGLGGALGSALGQFGGLASLAGIDVSGGGMSQEEALAVLKSREFTEKFILDRNLMPQLFADEWDAASGKWKSSQEKPPTPGKAYRFFDKKVRSISQDKKTGLVTLQIDWTDRKQAAAWANELAERLNAEMRSRAIEMVDASIGYLERELEKTRVVATRDAISRLIEAQVRQRMIATVMREYSFRIVDKAMVADADDPVRPKRLILIVAGFGIGMVLGVALALFVAPLLHFVTTRDSMRSALVSKT